MTKKKAHLLKVVIVTVVWTLAIELMATAARRYVKRLHDDYEILIAQRDQGFAAATLFAAVAQRATIRADRCETQLQEAH